MGNNNQSLGKRYMLIGVITTILLLAVSAYGWIQIPTGDRIPIHWNLAGEVDRTTGKAEGLLLFPAISLVVFFLLSLVPKIEPRKLNIDQSAKAYLATGFVFGGILLLLQILIVLTALGYDVDTPRLLTAALGLMFIVTGNFLGKIRSNFIFGVRTPWTLSSELSWNKTHRLAGKLFVVCGLIVLAFAFILSPAYPLICAGGGLFLIIVSCCVYSYLVWRSDPAAQHA